MAFLVIVIIGGLAQVFIFLSCWLIAVTVILRQSLGRVDPSRRGKALRLRAAWGAIATIFIPPILLVVPAQSLQGLSLLVTMGRHGLCLLGAERKESWCHGCSLLGFKAERWPWGQQAPISQTHKGKFKTALALLESRKLHESSRLSGHAKPLCI